MADIDSKTPAVPTIQKQDTAATTTTTNNGNTNANQSEWESSPMLSFMTSIQPTHLMLVASLPLCMGAYMGYKLELGRIGASAAANSAAADAYSPGFTSSGGGLLKRVVGEEVLSANKNKSKKGVKNANNTTTSTKNTKNTNNTTKNVQKVKGVKGVKGNVTKMAKTMAKKAVEQAPELSNVNPAGLAFRALGVGSLLSVGGFGLLTFAVFKATGSESLDDLITKCRKWTPNKRKQFESSLGIKPKSMQHEDVKATKGMSEDEEWEFLKKKYIPELAEENNETET
jgi:hypothetical protein